MMIYKLRYLWALLLVGVVVLPGNDVQAQEQANYRLAERLREVTRSPLNKNTLEVMPRFIHQTDCFWYTFRTEEGKQYWLVDPGKKRKQLLFDRDELAIQISGITRKPYNARDLDIDPEFDEKGESFSFSFDGRYFSWDIRNARLTELEKEKKGWTGAPYWMYYSPDSTYMLFAHKHDLYAVGNPEKGMDTTEIRLTSDGERNYSFNREDEGELEGRFGASAKWMKRGNKFYAVRSDSRKVSDLWLINVLAKPRPELVTYKAELAGDTAVIQYELLIGDVETREVRKIDISRWKDQYIDVLYTSNDGERLYFQRYKRTWNECEICVVNTTTGEVKVLIHETDKPYLDYHMRAIHFLNDGKEILFRSERTGWGHYYLYDGEGNLKRAVTSGAWVAGPVQKIDTLKREIWFTGFGREKELDPYYYLLYRVSLDKENSLALLTPENATHQAAVSPSHKYIVDSYSRVDMEPRNVVRDRRGKVIMELEQPDLRRLYEFGWQKPERFKVKAADGVTDLYGVMWKPVDFDSTRYYPIISSVYPGPQYEYVQTRFTINDDQNTRLAQVGFIVVSVGHRGGTPMRGQYYHTYGYGNQRDYPLADDKYAIEQLADRYSFIDRSRVGIFGHSGGGFMSTAALLTYPDFYSAAVSSAGNHDNNIYNKGWVEIHFGVKEEKTVIKDSVNGDQEKITFKTRSKTNTELVKNYKGGLMLVTGDMDKTVHPAHTLRVAQELIKVGKKFDMLILPGDSHGFSGASDLFFERKMWFHFARHLLGDSSADTEGEMDYFMEK